MKKSIKNLFNALSALLLLTGVLSCTQPSSKTGNFDYNTCALGDFILKNGEIIGKNALSDSQKSEVAAIVIRTKTVENPVLAMGVVFSDYIAWCADDAKANGKNLTDLNRYSFNDGSESWTILKGLCDDATEENAATKYPAWNYCLKYAETNQLKGSLTSGWYFPTLPELRNISNNRDDLSASFTQLGLEFKSFLTCNQISDSAVSIIQTSDGYDAGCSKSEVSYRVCAVKQLK